jgi:cystathionine beta-lyase/cystathionine gamma-synthase
MAQFDELAEIGHQRPVAHRIPVIIGIKHAGHPFLPEQDQGISQSTIRLSIGTEHIDDIIADLEKGFATLPKIDE